MTSLNAANEIDDVIETSARCSIITIQSVADDLIYCSSHLILLEINVT